MHVLCVLFLELQIEGVPILKYKIRFSLAFDT